MSSSSVPGYQVNAPRLVGPAVLVHPAPDPLGLARPPGGVAGDLPHPRQVVGAPQGLPAAELGRRVVLLARELPQPGVAVAPHVARLVRHPGQQAARAGVEDVPVVDVEPDHVEHVTEHGQLQLVDRRVPDHDRSDPAPAGDLGELLRGGQLAVEAVEHLHLGTVPVDRAQQPADRRLGLLAEAEPEQRLHGVGGVADPGEAVVPVLGASVRDRRLSGSDVVAAAAIEPLGACSRSLSSSALRATSSAHGPGARNWPDHCCQAATVRSSRASTSRGVDRCSGSDCDAVTPHQVPGTGGGAKGAVDGLVGHLGLDLAEQPHRERHVVDAQDGAVHGVVRPGRRRVQAGAGGDREPHRDPARDPLDAAGELRPGQPPGAAEVQRVDDPDRSGRGDVRGLEDVRARQVAPRRARGLGGGELEPAAVAGRRGSRRTWGRSRGRGSATSRSGRRGRRARRSGCRRSGRRSAGRRSRPGDRGRRRAPRRGRARGRA